MQYAEVGSIPHKSVPLRRRAFLVFGCFFLKTSENQSAHSHLWNPGISFAVSLVVKKNTGRGRRCLLAKVPDRIDMIGIFCYLFRLLNEATINNLMLQKPNF